MAIRVKVWWKMVVAGKMWILKDLGEFAGGKLYGDATTRCKVGIFGGSGFTIRQSRCSLPLFNLRIKQA